MTVAAQSWAAVEQALRECVLGAIGTVRTVAADAFKLGAPDRVDDPSMAHRAREKKRVEIEIGRPKRLPLASVLCNRGIFEAQVVVRVVHASDHQILDEDRHKLQAEQMDDHDLLFDALTYPGNLATTSDSVATGLISGCLFPADGGEVNRQWRERFLRSTRIYTARLERSLAT